MRDPVARWASAGLILALPILIHIASATASGLSLTDFANRSRAGALGLAEAVLAVGLWVAARARRRLVADDGRDEPFELGRTPFTPARKADPLVG